MNKNTFNPIRRNRNIGTSKSGYGQNNSMRIPESWHDDRKFWSKVNNPVFVNIEIAEKNFTIIVEPVKSGFVHHVTPWDIEYLLSHVGEQSLDDLSAIVLRQPKKKENVIEPVWGRYLWLGEIGKHHGPMIIIEAQKENMTMRWSKSLKPEDTKELDRLIGDGHEIVTDKRYHHINCSSVSIRNTQLYRTLLHELGHYIDYRRNIVEKDDGDIGTWLKLVHRYDQQSSEQKEQFAHQFAEKLMSCLKNTGITPFDVKADVERMQENKLSAEWFAISDA